MADTVQEYIQQAQEALRKAEEEVRREGCSICEQLIQPLSRQIESLGQIRMMVNEYESSAKENDRVLSGILSTASQTHQQSPQSRRRRGGFGIMEMWQERPRLGDMMDRRRR